MRSDSIDKARKRGLTRYHNLKKAELIKKLSEPIQLRDRTIPQLKQLARKKGLTRYHNLKKAELIEYIRNPLIKYTKSELIQLARKKGLTRYYNLKKAELIEYIRNPLIKYTKSELIDEARKKGLTRYHTLKKAELIKRLKEQRSTILDRDIPARMANVPFLIPLPPSLKPFPPSMKPFEVRESDSALRNFAKVYTIDGEVEFDPRSFMDGARENLTKILRNNRNTKVKLILRCYMIHRKRQFNKKICFSFRHRRKSTGNR